MLATTANWVKRSMRWASRREIYWAMSKPFTSAANLTAKGEASNEAM
jgi:hypothetical protein